MERISFNFASLLVRDILHVREMCQKPFSEPLKPTLSATYAEESPTMNLQFSYRPTSGDAGPMITPLIVTLSAHTLALSLITTIIKIGKMHTSQLRVVSKGKCHTLTASFFDQYKRAASFRTAPPSYTCSHRSCIKKKFTSKRRKKTTRHSFSLLRNSNLF